MQNRFLLLAILAFFISAMAFAQTTTIKGVVIDQKTKQPLGFASVSVKAKSVEFFDGSPTDYDGHYSVDELPVDSLEITASFTGYIDEVKTIYNDGKKSVLTMNFALSNEMTNLQEVSVSAMKSQMRFELDKKVFDVTASSITEGASASDILAEIPSIDVETDGTISLRGSESVVIWINGKESGLTASNQAEVLEQFPADAIQSVELITNPSAKYSPEGTAGIINIVLKENMHAGYYGSVQAGVNTNLGYNVSGNINYTSGKVDVFASLGYSSRTRNNSSLRDRVMLDNMQDSIGFSHSEESNDNRGHNIFARLGATFHATKKDDISISGFGMFGGNKGISNVLQRSNLDAFDHSTRNSIDNGIMLGGNISLGYKHKFSTDHTLDLSLDYNLWNRNGDTWYEEREFYISPDSIGSVFQNQTSLMQYNSFNLKADYVNKFNDNHRIEAGYQGRFNRENAPTNTYDGFSEDNMLLNTDLSNSYIYDIYVNAIYATYAAKFGRFNFQAGLRGEHTHTSMTSSGYPTTTADYFDLFPSLFLNYELPKDNQLQLNYTRRIMRPGGWHLNPFKRIEDSKNISFGNPLLTPEYANALELNYIKTWANHMLSFSGYFRNTDNVIQRISYLDGGVMYTTPENIAKNISAGSELVAKNKITKYVNLTTTLNLFYYQLEGFEYTVPQTSYVVTGQGNSNFSWNIRMNAQVMLPWDMSLQLSGGYQAPRVMAQGTRQGQFRFGGGLKKTLGNWTFNINARNLLAAQHRVSETFGDNFRQKSSFWGSRLNVNFSVTYAFGNLKKNNMRERPMEAGDSMEPSGMEDTMIEGGDF